MKRFVNYKLIFAGFVIIILAFVLRNTISEFSTIKENGSYVDKLQNQLTEETNRNKFLEEQLKFVQTDDFIEQESREKLGLVKQGEVVVQEKFKPRIEQKIEEKVNKPNWKQWLELFI